MKGPLRLGSVLGLAVALAGALPAGAMAADFYKGRTIQVLIGFSAGGGYDLYARVLGRYMGKHIPGNPAVVPQNMPGAGSLKTANYIYNVAPKDGTVIGTFARGLPMEKLLGRTTGQNFDATKFNWLGSITDEPGVCVAWTQSGIRNWEDMKTKAFKVGGAGATDDSEVYPNVLRNMFHLPLRVITGYPGGNDVTLAMQRREIDGRCNWSWSSLQSRDKYMLDQKQITVLVQLGTEHNPDLPNVPLVLDLTSDPKQKAALRLIFSRQDMARPFAAPPNIPPERVKILRDAFDATMKDPEFVAEAKKLQLEVRPVSGDRIAQMVRDAYAAPPDVVKLAAQAIIPAK